MAGRGRRGTSRGEKSNTEEQRRRDRQARYRTELVGWLHQEHRYGIFRGNEDGRPRNLDEYRRLSAQRSLDHSRRQGHKCPGREGEESSVEESAEVEEEAVEESAEVEEEAVEESAEVEEEAVDESVQSQSSISPLPTILEFKGKPRPVSQLVTQQVPPQFAPPTLLPPRKDRKETPEKEKNDKEPALKKNAHKKMRPRLKNIDRSSAQHLEVTVGGLTVIITEFKEKTTKPLPPLSSSTGIVS